MFDPIASRISLALDAMNSPVPDDTPELDQLFERLRLTAIDSERDIIEKRIWDVWCTHSDPEATAALKEIMAAFENDNAAFAISLLDDTVERWPDWAEAWNKRATLRFVQDRYADSLDDISQTLKLEPRHFGALSGLGQICLREGDALSALLAFERVLSLDPNIPEATKAAELLRKRVKEAVH